MDQMATSAWPHQLVHDPTVPAPVEEDFTSFLDLGDFSINFSHFDVTAEQHGQDAANTMDMGLDDSAEVGAGSEVMMQQSPGDDARLQHHVSMPTMAQVQTPDDAVLDLNMHAQLFQQQEQQFQPRRRQHRLHEQVYHPQLIIPPTPNSIEMHASAARYIHQMDPQAQVLHYQRLKDAQVWRFSTERVLELMSSAGHVHASRVACSHPFGHAIQSSRVHRPRRIPEPADVSGSGCSAPHVSRFNLSQSQLLRDFPRFVADRHRHCEPEYPVDDVSTGLVKENEETINHQPNSEQDH